MHARKPGAAARVMREITMNFLKQYGPLLITLAGTIGAAIFTPAFISAHPVAFSAVNAAAQFLHAVLPSIFQTKESSQ
jgi:hypothetical protein